VSGFKVGDTVRCVNADPFRSGDPSDLGLFEEYEIDFCDDLTCGVVGRLWNYHVDRFELVTPTPPMTRFKPKDQVRCINNGPFVNGDPCDLILGGEYEIKAVFHGTCCVVGCTQRYYQDRFTQVTTAPPVHVHEGRRYRETSRGTFANDKLSIIAERIPLTRDEIIARAAKILRADLFQSRIMAPCVPNRAYDAAIDAAIASVVDDVMLSTVGEEQ